MEVLMRQRVFSLLVENEAGVLSRIAGLFSRRGYNIDSLTVGVTENPSVSRMTVAASGEEDVLDQIEKQLSKLIDVKSIEVLPEGASVCRELILCRVKCDASERSPHHLQSVSYKTQLPLQDPYHPDVLWQHHQSV